MSFQVLFDGIDRYLTPVAVRISNQRHVNAIRDGFISSMPFLIVGSFLLLLAHPPFEADTTFSFGQWWVGFAKKYSAELLMPYNMTMGIMAVFITTGIAFNLAQFYKLNAYMAAVLALMSFLVVAAPIKDGTFSAKSLGGEGIFTGMIIAIFCVEVMHFLSKRNIGLKLPEQVPPKIRESFDLLIPILLIFCTLYPLNLIVEYYFDMLLPQAIMSIFAPIVSASDSLPAVVITVLLCHLLWFAGIHGAAIVGGLLQVFFMTNLGINQQDLNAGMPISHIYVQSFWDFFIIIGGSGATFGLILLYMRSKSVHLRTIGKLSFVPGIFQISEPVIFGSPVVMNPILFIPFILAPVVNSILAWYAIKLGIIGHVVSLAPWTTPAPIGAAWVTGWDFMAVPFVLFLIVLSMVIYYPFFKVYESQLVKQESYNGK